MEGHQGHRIPLIVSMLCSACCVIDEQMYRCEDCDELFTSKLELRRHQKYSCTNGSSIFDSLNEDLKQEQEDNDEPVHECKDCEKVFPNEYRSVEMVRYHLRYLE